MTTTHHGGPDARLLDALADTHPSTRLRAALAAGTTPDPRLAPTLLARCAIEPDFYVRDMLTWALCRLPADVTVPGLLAELGSAHVQAHSQALHTLSKIGDRRGWPAASALLHDQHDGIARAAWRAAVALVPPGHDGALATALTGALGRGDRDMQLALSRALVALGDAALPALGAALAGPDPRVRGHAEATERLLLDPDSGFTLSLELATRVAATGPDAG